MSDERIDRMVDAYLEQTSHMSITSYGLKLPVAQDLMAEGRAAVPALLRALASKHGGMSVITLLGRILPDANPYTPEKVCDTGFAAWDVSAAVSAWLEYGIKNGYTKP